MGRSYQGEQEKVLGLHNVDGGCGGFRHVDDVTFVGLIFIRLKGGGECEGLPGRYFQYNT